MAYDPLAPTEQGQANAFRGAWIGLVTTLVLILAYFLPVWPWVETICLAATALLAMFMLTGRHDDYFNVLREIGMRWAMATIGLWLFAHAFFAVGEIAYKVGSFAAGARPDIIAPKQAAPFNFLRDAYLLAIVSSLGFFAGFAFARVRRAA